MGSLNHRYLILLTSVLLTACSTLERKAAVPSSDLSKAQIAGQASSRYLIATNTGINTFVADVDAMNKKMNKQSQGGKSHYLSL